MRIICAWCKVVIRETDTTALWSHGMCADCLRAHGIEVIAEIVSDCSDTRHSKIKTIL